MSSEESVVESINCTVGEGSVKIRVQSQKSKRRKGKPQLGRRTPAAERSRRKRLLRKADKSQEESTLHHAAEESLGQLEQSQIEDKSQKVVTHCAEEVDRNHSQQSTQSEVGGAIRRAADAERQRVWRQSQKKRESQKEAEARRAADALRLRRWRETKRANETEEQAVLRRAADAERQRSRRRWQKERVACCTKIMDQVRQYCASHQLLHQNNEIPSQDISGDTECQFWFHEIFFDSVCTFHLYKD